MSPVTWRNVPAMDRLEFFARAAADAPQVARVRFGYAVELQRAGRLQDAVGEYRAYLDLHRDEGNAWQRLGECLTALGRTDEAADAYLAGIDAALAHGHTGMAETMRDAVDAL